MITFKKLMVVIIALGLPGLVQADIYKYLDEEGAVQFTDNLANVPADQRNQVESYEEVVHPIKRQVPSLTGQETDDVLEAAGQDNGKSGDGPSGLVDDVGYGDEQGPLGQSGARLRAEYEALMKERAELEEAASAVLPANEQKRLQEKIQDFNERIKDFDIRRQAHNEAVEAHNVRLETQGRDLQEEVPVE